MAQERLWFLERFESGNPVFHLSAALRLRGALDPALLERSLHRVIARHEVLRTSFPARDGQPVGIVAATLRLPLAVLDLSALSPAGAETELRRRTLALARQPFDGERGPLVRTALLRLDRGEHVLLLTCHRLVADEWSLGLIHRELAAIYQASPLPELRRRYAEYAHRRRQWLQGDAGRAEIAWWRRQLAGAPAVLELPCDRPRGALPSYRGGRVTRILDPALTAALEVPSDALLLAAFKTLLMRITGQQDVVVGLAVANREGKDCEPLIGPLANTLVLRTDLRGDLGGLGPLAARIAAAVRSAREHQALPFEALVEALQPERNMSHQPLCQVIFAGSDALPPPPELPGLTLRALDLDWGTARHDLTLAVRGGKLALDYDAELFDAVTVRRALAHLQTLLAAAVADPEAGLAELPLLAAGERHQLVREWNDTRVPYPREATLHELVAAQAETTPEALAVVDAAVQVSYRELDRRADRLARHLRGQGVGPEVRVGLCVERSVDMLVAILAILKAGGAYVPLDPGYPPERLAFMLADAGARVVVTQERLRPAAPPEVRLVHLDRELPEPAAGPAPEVTADHLAYVMYTSGSTGIPKGVSVVHRAVVRLVREANYVRLSAREVFLQLAPISFDASTLEIWAPLLHGGRLVVPPPSPPSLAELGELIAR
ncbi:MAG: AMP-binding protein, partial [bacterium]|nr:AMP-binding protein [bacterium]